MRYIYALLDNGEVFYIGQTMRIKVRYESHINDAKKPKCAKDYYIQNMLNENRQLGIAILVICDDNEASKKEGYYINKYLNLGASLFNKRHAVNRHIPPKWAYQRQ